MRIPVLFALLTVLSTLHAQEGKPDPKLKPANQPTAQDIFRQAVAAQGSLRPDDVRDLYVRFVGQVQEQGEKTQSATREYWLRPTDRSFRIKTTAGADPAQPFSERGVLGAADEGRIPEQYWESIKRKRTRLSRSNRDHRDVIKAIRRDRTEFERIVRMVLLVRLANDDAKITFARPDRVRLVEDQPDSARHILGKDRKAEYYVLDVTRKNADPLRMFIREDDSTVRKVIQFDRAAPGRIKTVSYFGFYRANKEAEGLILPQAFSVYSAVPDGKNKNEETMMVSGQLKVRVNDNLDNATFAPK